MAKKKFYNIKPILDTNADFNLIYGQKGNGKTTTTLQHLIEEYYHKGKEFVILRRFDEDFKQGRARQVFADINERGFVKDLTSGEWDIIEYWQRCWYFAKLDPDTNKAVRALNPIAYARSLAAYEHDNGSQFPNVYNMVFDEFITKNELYDEFTTFMKVYDNIRRRKENFKVFLLGNTVNYFSTYWENFCITNYRTQQPGTIDVYTLKYQDTIVKVACEYCENVIKGKEKATIAVFAHNNPKLNMIVSGEHEIGFYHKPPEYSKLNIVYTFFIEFHEYIFQCELVNLKNNVFLHIHEKTTPYQKGRRIVYSNEPHFENFYRGNLFDTSDNLGKYITYCFKNNKVFYGTNETGSIIESYLNEKVG